MKKKTLDLFLKKYPDIVKTLLACVRMEEETSCRPSEILEFMIHKLEADLVVARQRECQRVDLKLVKAKPKA
jgi:hypothetical protein